MCLSKCENKFDGLKNAATELHQNAVMEKVSVTA